MCSWHSHYLRCIIVKSKHQRAASWMLHLHNLNAVVYGLKGSCVLCTGVRADVSEWVVFALCYVLCCHLSNRERCTRTWFPGGDGGAWRGRSCAGTVVCQNSDVVSSAGSKSGHPGCRLQARRPHAVRCCFSFVLPPVPDLLTHKDTSLQTFHSSFFSLYIYTLFKASLGFFKGIIIIINVVL